jgi:hypothetical protein
MARNGQPSWLQQGNSRKYEIEFANGVLKASDKDGHELAMEVLDRLDELGESLDASSLRQIASALSPAGLIIEGAVQNYSEVKASGLKMNIWSGRLHALKSFVDKRSEVAIKARRQMD